MISPGRPPQNELSLQRAGHAALLAQGLELPQHLDLTLSEALVIGLLPFALLTVASSRLLRADAGLRKLQP